MSILSRATSLGPFSRENAVVQVWATYKDRRSQGQISSSEAAPGSFVLLADGYLALSSVHLLAEDRHNYTHYEDEKVEGTAQRHTTKQGPSTRSLQWHPRS